MCGIFGYANYGLPLTRRQILDLLVGGLRRLEYRGYDSAGIAIDAGTEDQRNGFIVLKEKGNIDCLVKCDQCGSRVSLISVQIYQQHPC